MTDIRWKDKQQLAALVGSEVIPATSIAGGSSTPSGTVAANEDVFVTITQLLATRIMSAVSSNTVTPDGFTDLVRPPALTANTTLANPSASPVDGWGFVFDLIDNGSTRTLTWGSKYANRMANLPTATTAGKRHRIGVEYNATDDKYYCMFAQVQS